MIILGKRISRSIDITNSISKMINRLINFSSFMYVLVNCITLAAMINTVLANKVPSGSIIIGILMFVDSKGMIFHSIMNVLLIKLTVMAAINDALADMDKTDTVAVSMIKDFIVFLAPQVSVLK